MDVASRTAAHRELGWKAPEPNGQPNQRGSECPPRLKFVHNHLPVVRASERSLVSCILASSVLAFQKKKKLEYETRDYV